MIELPDDCVPSDFLWWGVDLGFVQEGSAGLGDRIDRPGNHFACEATFPPMKPDLARRFATRVHRATREGLRIEIPLLGVHQGLPGAPVVDGDGQAGTALALRGLTPHYAAKEGFWLTATEALTGQRYAHRVQGSVAAEADGTVTLEIEPPLRAPLADGDTIELAHPTIEGALLAPARVSLAIDQLVRLGASLTIQEVA